ncbi:MAG TPA: tetratricopeptide repeat protein, partial [Candidatus Hydrogenedentes bacterium]|nr:tetratricopeptide repeat protein [Candidatus Hydrogenedentota bacterium]
MSRKLWLIIGVAALFILLLCAAGVWGAVLYRARQIDQSLEFANAHFAAGEWGLAKNHFRRYLAEHPKDVEALGKYALACVNTLEDRPKALRDATIAYYHIAINNPNDEAALRSLIELYEKRRAWNDLEYYAGYFIRRYPDRTWLKYERAVALDNMQRGEQAIEAYRELTEAGAAYADVYGNLARLLYGDGLRDEAQAVLEEAEARFPDAALIRLQWPRYYLGIEDVERAGETIQEVLDLAPNDPEVLSVAARVAVARKQWQEAALFCEQALKQRPDRAETYLVLAGAYQKIGEVAKTLSLLENMDPLLRVDYPEFFLFHHDLLILEERFEEARRVLDEYRAAYPGHAVMFDYMEARELLAKGEATRASVVLTTVVESNPNFAPAQYYQAVAYLQSYKRDRAWNVLVRLLRNFPDDERARALYERAFG